MDLYEKVDKRVSVRSYSEEMPSLELIESCLKWKPLNPKVELNIKVLEKARVYTILRGIVGNYGKVEAPSYLIIQGKDNEESKIEAGFRLEQAILELAEKDIGTCWIGGFFDRRGLDNLMEGSEGFTSLIIIALGYPAEGKQHIFSAITRGNSKKTPRKPLDQLGIKSDALDEKMLRVFDCGRKAPSAVNKQPWYFPFDKDRIDVFLTKGIISYKNILFDGGIVLSHLYLAALEEGFDARIVDNKENPPVNGLVPFKSIELGIRSQ